MSAAKDIDELLTSILSGQAAFVTPEGYAFIIDARSYPGRQPEEPDTEKVIRGSRDGFTETLLQNTALFEEEFVPKSYDLKCIRRQSTERQMSYSHLLTGQQVKSILPLFGKD